MVSFLDLWRNFSLVVLPVMDSPWSSQCSTTSKGWWVPNSFAHEASAHHRQYVSLFAAQCSCGAFQVYDLLQPERVKLNILNNGRVQGAFHVQVDDLASFHVCSPSAPSLRSCLCTFLPVLGADPHANCVCVCSEMLGSWVGGSGSVVVRVEHTVDHVWPTRAS